MIQIREERESDYGRVEEIIRKAFYNLYTPGCFEHYLAHTMRGHEDFIPELDLVLELDGQVIGNVMYTRAGLESREGERKEILTFGPLSILPEYQRKGYGKMLLERSFQKARELGYGVIVIFGNPGNYVARGFKSCKRYQVCAENGEYPAAMLVKELEEGALEGKEWIYRESPAMQLDSQAARQFDEGLEKLEKKYQASQEEFYILSQAVLR